MAKSLISQCGCMDLSRYLSQSRLPRLVRLNQQVPQQSEPPFGMVNPLCEGIAAGSGDTCSTGPRAEP